MPAKTITEAIISVLNKEKKALSIKEITKHINENNLYAFKTSNSEHVVRNQLRRHSDNIELKTASQTKYFVANINGTYDLK